MKSTASRRKKLQLMSKNQDKIINKKQKEFKKLYKQIKKITKPLDKVEINVYAAHFYDFLRIHQEYLKKGFYNEMWQIFRSIKEQGLEEGPEYKKLGDYGINLISLILYSDDDELKLIENIIALHKLLDYITNKEE